MITITIEEPYMTIGDRKSPVSVFECPNCKIDVCYLAYPPTHCELCKYELPNTYHLLHYPIKRIRWHKGEEETG